MFATVHRIRQAHGRLTAGSHEPKLTTRLPLTLPYYNTGLACPLSLVLVRDEGVNCYIFILVLPSLVRVRLPGLSLWKLGVAPGTNDLHKGVLVL